MNVDPASVAPEPEGMLPHQSDPANAATDRVDRNFYWTLIAAAQRSRREAAALRDPQAELFA